MSKKAERLRQNKDGIYNHGKLPVPTKTTKINKPKTYLKSKNVITPIAQMSHRSS